ncbi:hypothetical protein WJX73_004469 [Symbiochloris irregularis]|uniref:DUF7781 domain-containing protein n=1 Tax=Symbiochloris irregularis TaxID=706552 RepID=A0AAW1PH88_9CHLO
MPHISDQSDDEPSEYSDYVDTLDDIFERYNVTIKPYYALKMRKSWREFNFSANVNTDPQGQERYMSYHVKPCQYRGPRLLHKLSACPKAQAIRLSSAKLNLLPWTDFVKLSIQADYDYVTRGLVWGYSITSKWSLREIVRKERVKVEDSLELRTHWKLSVDMPEIKSTFGRRDTDETEVHKGYAKLNVPKVVANLSLDRPWPLVDRPLRLLGRRGADRLAETSLRADLTRLDALRSEVLRGRPLDEMLSDRGYLGATERALEERRASRDAGPLSVITSPLQGLGSRSDKEIDAPSTRPEPDSQQQPPRTDRPGNLLLWRVKRWRDQRGVDDELLTACWQHCSLMVPE